MGQVGLLTNMPTAIAYFGVAPMKNADWDRFVVPVLAMTVWPLVEPEARRGAAAGGVEGHRPVDVGRLRRGEHLR